MCGSSWLPRFTNTASGCDSFSAKIKSTISHEWSPRSTRSPLNTYTFEDEGMPSFRSRCNKSSCVDEGVCVPEDA